MFKVTEHLLIYDRLWKIVIHLRYISTKITDTFDKTNRILTLFGTLIICQTVAHICYTVVKLEKYPNIQYQSVWECHEFQLSECAMEETQGWMMPIQTL